MTWTYRLTFEDDEGRERRWYVSSRAETLTGVIRAARSELSDVFGGDVAKRLGVCGIERITHAPYGNIYTPIVLYVARGGLLCGSSSFDTARRRG